MALLYSIYFNDGLRAIDTGTGEIVFDVPNGYPSWDGGDTFSATEQVIWHQHPTEGRGFQFFDVGLTPTVHVDYNLVRPSTTGNDVAAGPYGSNKVYLLREWSSSQIEVYEVDPTTGTQLRVIDALQSGGNVSNFPNISLSQDGLRLLFNEEVQSGFLSDDHVFELDIASGAVTELFSIPEVDAQITPMHPTNDIDSVTGVRELPGGDILVAGRNCSIARVTRAGALVQLYLPEGFAEGGVRIGALALDPDRVSFWITVSETFVFLGRPIPAYFPPGWVVGDTAAWYVKVRLSDGEVLLAVATPETLQPEAIWTPRVVAPEISLNAEPWFNRVVVPRIR